MSGFLNRVNLMISRYLSNRLFLREHGILLGVMTCMLMAGAFSSAFINTFLYNFPQMNATVNADGILLVVKYNLYSAAYMLLFCCMVGIFAKKLTYKASMTFGAVLHVMFYGCMMLFWNNIHKHIGIISLLSGMSTAFFYISYNSLMNVMIGSVARKQYVLFQSIISVVIGVVFPVLSGLIIFLIGVPGGYVTMFLICAVMCIISTLLCVMLPKVRGQSRRTYFAGVLVKSLSSSKYFMISVCDIFRGLKDGIIMFLIPVLIIKLTGNVFWVGAYVSVCAVSGMLGNLATQKVSIAKYPYISMLVTAIIQVVAVAMLIFKINILTVLMFGVISAFCSPVFAASMHIEYYNVMAAVDASMTKKTLETTCVKEVYFNFGRIVAIILMSLVIKNTVLIMALNLAFFILQIVSWIICVSCCRARRQTDYEQV